MTDPNVIEAIRKITEAVRVLVEDNGDWRSTESRAALIEADALLAAEKPAAPVATPVASDLISREAAIRAVLDRAERTFGQQTSTANGYADAIRALPAAPVPAPAPVAPSLPWQPALSQAAMEINGLNRGDGEHGDYVRLDEVRDALSRMRDTLAAAPAAPVVPVKFDRLGRADGASWSADFYPDGATPYATVTIHLRPGEDAGVTTATMLSSVGRGL